MSVALTLAVSEVLCEMETEAEELESVCDIHDGDAVAERLRHYVDRIEAALKTEDA